MKTFEQSPDLPACLIEINDNPKMGRKTVDMGEIRSISPVAGRGDHTDPPSIATWVEFVHGGTGEYQIPFEEFRARWFAYKDMLMNGVMKVEINSVEL